MSAIILGHKHPDTDSIVSAIACADLYKKRGLDVVPAAQGTPAPETAFVLERFGLKAPEVITSVAGREVYIVDYSDLNQAPDDFAECTLKGIVDHHKLGDMTSTAPLECVIMPVGCTNTILKRMYDYLGFVPPKEIAGAMLCAILSDTVIFKSPTCTKKDIAMAERLTRIARISLKDLGRELFSSTSDGKSAEELLGTDYKEFHISGQTIGVGQITCVDSSKLVERRDEFIAAMEKVKQNSNCDLVILMITDVLLDGSHIFYVGSDDVMQEAFSTVPKDKHMFLPKVMSRKKQIIPMLTAMWG